LKIESYRRRRTLISKAEVQEEDENPPKAKDFVVGAEGRRA